MLGSATTIIGRGGPSKGEQRLQIGCGVQPQVVWKPLSLAQVREETKIEVPQFGHPIDTLTDIPETLFTANKTLPQDPLSGQHS